jgi:bifunctional non-homologous end joining protein LigD
VSRWRTRKADGRICVVVAPMLVRPAPVLPAGEEWAYEVRWDGMRALVSVGSTVRVHSRHDHTAAFPELAALGSLFGRAKVVLNGELVCLDPPRDGPPSSASWPGPYVSRGAHASGGG